MVGFLWFVDGCYQVIVCLIVGKDSYLEGCVVVLWSEVAVIFFVLELCSVRIAFVPFVVLGSYPYDCSVLVHVCVPCS